MMNKILFVYDYEYEEVWSTPYSLEFEFSKRGWGVNRLRFQDVNEYRSLPNYDVVLVMDWQGKDISNKCKKMFSNQKTFLIKELGDTPQNYDNHLQANLKDYNWLFTPDYYSAIAYKKYHNLNCDWITHWADTNIQYPKNVELKYTAVTTRGKGNSQVLDAITEWGQGTIGNQNRLDGYEHTDFLNSGLIVIQNSRWGEVTRRIFEGMACGKLVITDRLKPDKKLNELFTEGKEIVLYDSIEDLANKINYYAEHNDKREDIAIAGRDKVLKNYTQVQVVDKIIQKWGNFRSALVY